MNLSPSDMKSLLYHILSGKEFGVERSGELQQRASQGKAECTAWPDLPVPTFERCPCSRPCSAQMLQYWRGPAGSSALHNDRAE